MQFVRDFFGKEKYNRRTGDGHEKCKTSTKKSGKNRIRHKKIPLNLKVMIFYASFGRYVYKNTKKRKAPWEAGGFFGGRIIAPSNIKGKILAY
jgi:hypothetical protein